MNESNAFLEFTDADFKSALKRTLRTIAVLAAILSVVITILGGWQSGMLLLVGAIVSASGVYEWQRLIGVVNARLDNAKSPRGTVAVVSFFFLRLLVVAGIVYLSLRYLHGSIYALVAGLALAVVGLSIEAVRLVRA